MVLPAPSPHLPLLYIFDILNNNTIITKEFHSARVLALGSQHKGADASYLRSLVLDQATKQTTRPGHQLVSVLRVSFNALTLLVGDGRASGP